MLFQISNTDGKGVYPVAKALNAVIVIYNCNVYFFSDEIQTITYETGSYSAEFGTPNLVSAKDFYKQRL